MYYQYPDAKLCPAHLVESLTRYAEHGVPVGGFLTACLENNLLEAIARADGENLPLLPHIVAWLYEYMPFGAWRSRENVEAWLATKRAARERSHGAPITGENV